MHNRLNLEFPDTNFSLFVLNKESSTFVPDCNFLKMSYKIFDDVVVEPSLLIF